MSTTAILTSNTFKTTAAQPVVIREATADDRAALVRLAERDSEPVPEGRMIIAETQGELRAAVEVESGRAIADPFRHTADLVGLLRARAKQLGTSQRGRLRIVARSVAPVAERRGIERAAA
jgi:hypothetical protein